MDKPILKTTDLTVSAGKQKILNPVSLEIPTGGVFGIIGPSGAGKSTYLKSLNRLIELSPGLKVEGQVFHMGEPVYDSGVDPDKLRSRIGMLFQQPVVFPCSILANVLFGVRHLGVVPKKEWPDVAEKALREAALWDEVKDRLRKPGQQLSVGQQQRLCLARTLATGTEVILMDEPTSALDPKSTEAIEELILRIKETRTVVLVTHNMQQTEKICENVAFIGIREGVGTMLATGDLCNIQARSDVPELEDYMCCELPEGKARLIAG